MRIRFVHKRLEMLYTEEKGASRYPRAVVDNFFEAIQYMQAAPDERDLYQIKAFHYEKLHGRAPDRSLRLNKQWRLIVIPSDDAQGLIMEIVAIEDYH